MQWQEQGHRSAGREKRSGRRTRTVALVATVTTVVVAVLLGAAPPSVAASASRVLLVDDDRVQCPKAGYTSVRQALASASDGDRIRVCPGRYTDPLTVDRSVTLQGTVAAVAALECMAPGASALDDLDPTRFAILQPRPAAGDGPTAGVQIAANDVELAGFVVQGVTDDAPEQPSPGVNLYDAAISVSNSHSGTQLHHNLIRLNTLGVEFGSSGERASRVDHNCFRDNEWALANQRYTLTAARIDDNVTFRTALRTFEIGWTFAGTTDVRIDHNTSLDERAFQVFWVENAVRPRVEANVVLGSSSAVVLRVSEGAVVRGNRIRTAGLGVASTRNTSALVADNRIVTAGLGVALGGGNVGVTLRENVVTGQPAAGTLGIVLFPPGAAPVNTGLRIEANIVTNLQGTPGTGLAVNTGAVDPGSVLRANVLSRNAGDGLLVGPGIRGLGIVENVAEGNGGNGISLAAGTSENVLRQNTALRNGTDARDESAGTDPATLLNSWVDTTCSIDVPIGLICGARRSAVVSS